MIYIKSVNCSNLAKSINMKIYEFGLKRYEENGANIN